MNEANGSYSVATGGAFTCVVCGLSMQGGTWINGAGPYCPRCIPGSQEPIFLSRACPPNCPGNCPAPSDSGPTVAALLPFSQISEPSDMGETPSGGKNVSKYDRAVGELLETSRALADDDGDPDHDISFLKRCVFDSIAAVEAARKERS